MPTSHKWPTPKQVVDFSTKVTICVYETTSDQIMASLNFQRDNKRYYKTLTMLSFNGYPAVCLYLYD